MTSEPPFSRLFVVCGKSCEADTLTAAFSPFGVVQNVKLVREKGVAYIKFDKASSAAKAIEHMHERVLNNGAGPLLKVFLAEAPNARRGLNYRPFYEQEVASDPDNTPPRSRLFLVVPKTANGVMIEAEMATYQYLQYCKTDLIASKGVVFCKYAKSSSALAAMETINETGMLAGYKVKCMLAEPKGKRGRTDGPYQDAAAALHQAIELNNARALAVAAGNMQSGAQYSPTHSAQASMTPGLQDPRLTNGALSALQNGRDSAEYEAMSNSISQNTLGTLTSLANLQALAAMQGAANLSPQANLPQSALGSNGNGALPALSSTDADAAAVVNAAAVNAAMAVAAAAASNGALDAHDEGYGSVTVGSNHLPSVSSGPVFLRSPTGSLEPVIIRSPAGSLESVYSVTAPVVSRQRLFVVVSKSASEDAVAHLFRCFPGMEYCDLKKERQTGLSKGFAYVNYSTPEAAAAAIAQLHGIEFPVGSGHSLKVMYAEPIGSKGSANTSPLRPVLQRLEVSEDSDEIMHHSGHSNGMQQLLSDMSGSGEFTSRYPLPSTEAMNETLENRVDAVQNSLAHMSMPGAPSVQASGRAVAALLSATGSGTDESWGGDSPVRDETTVFTVLTRPMPEYAIEHTFKKEVGPVDMVRLALDKRVGVVKLKSPEMAKIALERLNGTEICGEGLTVTFNNPLHSARFTKRARVGM